MSSSSSTPRYKLSQKWARIRRRKGKDGPTTQGAVARLLQSVIFDEIDLTDLSVAECSTKNENHSFQVSILLLINTIRVSIFIFQCCAKKNISVNIIASHRCQLQKLRLDFRFKTLNYHL